ncbi:hypothetical protein QBC37DRAFT_402075 [Rhypophila decipiens]|uniref:Uncharacterized protein n=1 Tax=Rhypophila decipiens TaxID=261697 RepID=A0AAN6Y3B4_9PEZI|nr:hypothetical protein QBC37DRAFT_402075 [Rhypophila decipiens]
MANSTYPGMTPQKPPSGRRTNRTADTKQEPSAAQPRHEKEQSEPGHGKSRRQDSDGETRRLKPELETLENFKKYSCHHVTCGDGPSGHTRVDRRDHGPPRKSKNSLLTVSQGDDRPTDGQARQTKKRKVSGTKPPRGGKKTQKSRRRSPSPPSPPSSTFIHSFTSVERASSPEEDQFVTSRRPSAASIMPEGDEDTSTTLPPAYPASLENLDNPSTLSNGPASFTPASIHVHNYPQQSAQHMFSIPQDEQHASYAPYNTGAGHYPPQHSAYPGPPPLSTYRYDSRVAPYGDLSSYVSVDPNPALPAFVSGPPIHEPPITFNLNSFQTHNISPQTPIISPGAPIQTTIPNGYEAPVSVQSVFIQQSTPTFQRVVDDKMGTRINIAAPQTTVYRPSSYGRGFTQEGDVFELEICPVAARTAPHGNEMYHYTSSG